MLDQCIITVPNGPRVKPEIFTEENFKIDGWLEFFAVENNHHRQRCKDGINRTSYSTFDLFGTRFLRFRTRPVGLGCNPTEQCIDRIELNLAKIAYGHNAIPIRCDREFCGLLILVRHVLSKVLIDPTKASVLIPGLVKNSHSHWSKIEIGLHVEDPNHDLHRAMRRTRSARARSSEFFDNSVRQNGTNVLMKAYDKTTAMVAKKYGKTNLQPSTNNPITRLELELRGPKVATLLPLPDGTPALVRKHDNKSYLLGFTLEHLKLTFRDFFSDLKALYHAPKKTGEGENAGMAAVLAAVHMRSEMPIDELVQLYVRLGMRDRKKIRSVEESENARKRAQTDMRALIERFLEASCTFTADELFSDKAFDGQPIIGVNGLYSAGENYTQRCQVASISEFAHDPHADRQIRDVYTVRNSNRFTPVIRFTWYT